MLLLIDNYDSFTYNLVHYFEELGQEVIVFRNDQISAENVLNRIPNYIVISPGPSSPKNAGICIDLIKKNANYHPKTIPLLGVCLGHQAIAEAFGGYVEESGKPIHGKVSEINHNKSVLYQNIQNPFQATRYHSLIVNKNKLPKILEVTSQTKDGTIMGMSHKELPIFGVQFHPESIATEYGHQLLKNFLSIKK